MSESIALENELVCILQSIQRYVRHGLMLPSVQSLPQGELSGIGLDRPSTNERESFIAHIDGLVGVAISYVKTLASKLQADTTSQSNASKLLQDLVSTADTQREELRSLRAENALRKRENVSVFDAIVNKSVTIA